MSIDSKKQLSFIAKQLCRDLRKRSTNAEKILWEVVRNRKLLNLKIHRQYPIFYDFNGINKFFIADFYCHEKRLVIEIDGSYHEQQRDYDNSRTEIINLLGIKVIRFTNEEIENNIREVIIKIKNETQST